jgi:prepilin-type N-terminal cleavage/methylation domain-containing protein
MKRILRTDSAFTLIELIVVVAIIGILIGIILPALLPAKAKSRDAKRLSDLAQIQLALEQYFNRCSVYPPLVSGALSISTPTASCLADSTSSVTLGSFISNIPVPPTGVTNELVYDYFPSSSSGPTDYILHVRLENAATLPYNGLTNAQLSSFVSNYGLQNPAWDGDTANSPCYQSPSSPKDYCMGPK